MTDDLCPKCGMTLEFEEGWDFDEVEIEFWYWTKIYCPSCGWEEGSDG